MLSGDTFKNIRVYCQSQPSLIERLFGDIFAQQLFLGLAFVAFWGIVLFGYDVGIVGGVVSQPYFESSFGLVNADGTINQSKDTTISSNVVSVLQAGAFCGALASAPLSDWIGRKWTLFSLNIIFSIGAILTTIAGGSRGIGYIYIGRVISGIGIGGMTAVAPAYVSECSPKDVRGRITGGFQLMVATGVMTSYFINRLVRDLLYYLEGAHVILEQLP
ncbi:hypothetical protein K503DRAFT_788310, partial [Rhizopogon vinicolor AM-OR11-026]